MTAEAGSLGWRALTAVSHSGDTVAAELAGHEVALDLCRSCLRNVLKAALGMETRHSASGPRAAGMSAEAQAALRSLSATEAYISASNARLAAWRSAEGQDEFDPC